MAKRGFKVRVSFDVEYNKGTACTDGEIIQLIYDEILHFAQVEHLVNAVDDLCDAQTKGKKNFKKTTYYKAYVEDKILAKMIDKAEETFKIKRIE